MVRGADGVDRTYSVVRRPIHSGGAKVLVAKNGRCMWWCDEDGSHSIIYGFAGLPVEDAHQIHSECQKNADKHNRKYHKEGGK